MTSTSADNSMPANATEQTSMDHKTPANIEEGSIMEKSRSITENYNATMSLDPVAERKLVWKFDLRLMPTLAIMYLFNALDKGNLGNAKTAGLEDDLNLVGNQYNLILSIFFIPFVLTSPFLGALGKMFGPSRVLPLMMFTFGMSAFSMMLER